MSNGQLCANKSGLQRRVTPSMHALVQSQMDRLPTVPGVVLRCASILSSPFCLDALLQMVPSHMVDCMATLEAQMMVLRDAHLAEPIVGSSFSFDACGTGRTWKVGGAGKRCPCRIGRWGDGGVRGGGGVGVRAAAHKVFAALIYCL